MIVKFTEKDYINLDRFDGFEITAGTEYKTLENGNRVPKSSLPYFIFEFTTHHITENGKLDLDSKRYWYKYSTEIPLKESEYRLKNLIVEKIRDMFDEALRNKDKFFDFDSIIRNIINQMNYEKIEEEERYKKFILDNGDPEKGIIPDPIAELYRKISQN